jgi:acyl-CoA synthetase (AMP-forming)/AMP-acid ligase II
VIRSVPGVREVLVKGRHSSLVGQLVSAEVVLDQEADPAAARRHIFRACRQRLARYKAPAIVEFKERLDMTGAGKVSRF